MSHGLPTHHRRLRLGAALSVAIVLALVSALVVGGARSAGQTSTPKLIGRVGPGRAISLKTPAGALVERLPAGTYRITVRDETKADNFHLFGAGVDRRTGVPFRGSVSWKASFRAGRTYTYRSDAHPRLRRTFGAVPATPPPTPTPTPAPEASLRLEITGPEELVYDSAQRCELFDVSDLPARAVRSSDGEVRIYLAGANNRQLVGPDLDHLRHDCTPALPSHMNDDPAAFDDNEWIAAPYSTDGRTVYSLVHMEQHRGREGAPPGYWAVTLAVSSDGGRTYQHATPPAHLVASIPSEATYSLALGGGWQGVGNPSNIVRGPDGFYYALATVNEARPPKSSGICLLRTDELSDPRAWRGWNRAAGWNVTFIDPYTETVSDRAAHICEPDPGLIDAMRGGFEARSLTYNTYLERYVVVTELARSESPSGFYFSTSSDLVHWTAATLIAAEPLLYGHGCEGDSVQYPSLIDPQSTSPVFETVGESAYLYYTRARWENCAQSWDRDLVRVPVRFFK